MANYDENENEIQRVLETMTVAVSEEYEDDAWTVYRQSIDWHSIVMELVRANEANFVRWMTRHRKFKRTQPTSNQNVFIDDDRWWSIDEIQRLIESTSDSERINGWIQRSRRLWITTATSTQRPMLQLHCIKEDPMEVRWNDKGEPVPLGRNVLGEPFATLVQKQSYLRTRSATQIFGLMKPTVKKHLVQREKDRIQRLNAHKKRLDSLQLQALEAKFQHWNEPALDPVDEDNQMH